MQGDFRVGGWLVQPKLNSISGNGKTPHVEPKAMQVLVYLAEHAGDVMAKERIIQTVWANTFVTDDVLTRAISELRKAFDDDPHEPRFIQTIPKGGYRLIAPVDWVDGRGALRAPAGGPSPPLRRRWVLAVTGGMVIASVAVLIVFNLAGLRDRLLPRPAPPSGKVRLVVLPFDNLSGDPEQEYFSDGITEEMTAQLARLHPERLAVIGRASAMTYKRLKKTIDEIGKELRVQYVLEGSVRRQGNRVRITAQLIKVGEQTHVWAQSYERDLRDVLALQSEVAQAVAHEVRIKLTPQEQTRLASARPVRPEAYELHIKGRFYLSRRSDEDVKGSIDYFQNAIEKDPTYAPAYAALSQAYIVGAFRALIPGPESYQKAEAAARKALELDDTLGEAHAALGGIRAHLWDWQGALHEFERAIDVDPNSATAHIWYADTLAELGRHDDALRENKRALELDPVSYRANSQAGELLYYAHRYDESIARYREALELYPTHPNLYHGLWHSYREKGMFDDANAGLLKAIELEQTSPEELAAYQKAYREGGAEGLWRHRLGALKQKGSRAWAIACYYTLLGEKDQAINSLERVLELRSGSFLTVDPCYDDLRSDPRFQDLLRRVNFPP
jgi:TolB-like protein/DNA-binding winged helix-turn-helix (wHTH) protein/Flp pilus assembly protein TadD